MRRLTIYLLIVILFINFNTIDNTQNNKAHPRVNKIEIYYTDLYILTQYNIKTIPDFFYSFRHEIDTIIIDDVNKIKVFEDSFINNIINNNETSRGVETRYVINLFKDNNDNEYIHGCLNTIYIEPKNYLLPRSATDFIEKLILTDQQLKK